MTLVDYYEFDKMPVFMAATPEFVKKHPDALVTYLKAWLDVANDFKNSPDKVADTIYSFYTSKGYQMSKDTFTKALARVEVHPGWPADLEAYMTKHAKSWSTPRSSRPCRTGRRRSTRRCCKRRWAEFCDAGRMTLAQPLSCTTSPRRRLPRRRFVR